jgi:NPCBM-associated, NEW3 domain of alpha-galactosidase
MLGDLRLRPHRRFNMTRKTPAVRIACSAAFLVLALAVVPVALAGKPIGGGGHKGGGGGCTQNAPVVQIDNTYSWAAWGSWDMPGQRQTYSIDVMNYDVGCSAASFVVTLSAPDGFSVSLPTNTVTVKSGSLAYLSADVTSPSGIADGDYPITATVVRAGTTSSAVSFTSYYKVYSSDTAAPGLYTPNPWDGGTVSGSSYAVTVSSWDDHAVKQIDLYIDGAYKTTAACNNIGYACQLYYIWSLSGVAPGQHTATFASTDWMGNVGIRTSSFTVG